jgi:hypothetical protein
MQVNTTGIRRFTDPDNKAKGDFHGHGQNFSWNCAYRFFHSDGDQSCQCCRM